MRAGPGGPAPRPPPPSRLAEQDRDERPLEVRTQQLGARIECPAKHRLRLVELPPHADALGALAREEECDAWPLAFGRPLRSRTGGPFAAGERGERIPEL